VDNVFCHGLMQGAVDAVDRLTRVVAALLSRAARLLPPGRRSWAEAVAAEAGQVAAGWPRLRWLAGGLRLVGREANVVRKVLYWLGAAAVAAAGGWVVWLTWNGYRADNPIAATDRVRVLAGAAALIVLPWVGRRHGWFGPVGGSRTARLSRLAGCAALCGVGLGLVRMDRYLFAAPHGPAPFSLAREIAAAGILGGTLLALAVIRAGSFRTDPAVPWCVIATASLVMLAAVPVQLVTVAYAGGVLAVTSRRPPVTGASLAAGMITGGAAGLTAGLAVHVLMRADDRYMGWQIVSVIAAICVLAALAGAAGAWRLPGSVSGDGDGDAEKLRADRIREGLLAGLVTGAAAALLLTSFSPVAVFFMVIGPLFGAIGGAAGGILAASHPGQPLPGRSWAAGLLARF
jgi:hypothetical protein